VSLTDHIPEDNGCIEFRKVLVRDHAGYTINNNNIPIINSLFASSGISTSNYRYYAYSQDSLQTQFPPFAKVDIKNVGVQEFTNGLQIFTSGIIYMFKNNVLNFTGGTATKGTGLITIPNLSTGQLRNLFLDHAEKFEQKGAQYKDSCLAAEFGYYNMNAGTGNSAEQLVKAWKVTMKHRIYPAQYPMAYYQDHDGSLIYYDNGIRTFR
jgi:hypothetical protein